MWNRDTINLHEEILVAFLNHNHQVIGVRYHSKWTAIATTIDIRQILSVWLKSNAKGMIIAHNHPEWTAHPSEADKEMTIQLDKASALCGMKLLDHIILSPDEDYYSFSDSWIIKWYAIDKLITKQALDTSLET